MFRKMKNNKYVCTTAKNEMEIDHIYSYYRNFSADNLTLIYRGDFNDDITDKLINLNEQHIESKTGMPKIKNKVSFLMAECFQNIIRHGEDAVPDDNISFSTGMFMTRSTRNAYYITSANLIENGRIPFLENQLSQINRMSKDELKTLYREILYEGEVTGKGGAGLGLIEMARRSGEQLDYRFEQVDEEHSFFYLQIKLENKMPVETTTEKPISIQSAFELHSKIISDRMLILYKGDFSQDVIMPVLKMVEDNIASQSEGVTMKKRVFSIMVEMLQNICKHAAGYQGKENEKREGIFILGKKKDSYYVSAGNFIERDKIDSLEKRLNTIAGMDKEALKKWKRQLLKESKNTPGEVEGLGLIDMARNTGSRLKFSFTNMDTVATASFFSLSAQV